MSQPQPERRAGARTAAILLLLALAPAAHGERLPARRYTIADGLAGDTVYRILRDRRGFLWFCTDEGFSRFSGRRFRTYGAELGAVGGRVEDFTEDRRGVRWIATADGVYRFDPAGGEPPRLKRVPTAVEQWAGPVTVVLAASDGLVWAGAQDGLFRVEAEAMPAVFSRAEPVPAGTPVHALRESSDGTVWAATEDGLFGFGDQGVLRYTEEHGLPHHVVRSVLEDRAGALWVGTANGLCRIEVPASPDSRCATPGGLREVDGWVTRLLEDRRGTLWMISTTIGLANWSPGDEAPTLPAGALGIDEEALSFAEDAAGNIWIGTNGSGAIRIARDGLRAYGPEEGLPGPRIATLLQTRSGALIAAASARQLFRYDGAGFLSVRPRFPERIDSFGWGWNQIFVEEPEGGWWLPTARGLCRFDPVGALEELERKLPRRVYTRDDGLAGSSIFRLFRDGKGNLWISTTETGGAMLTRRDGRDGTFHTYGSEQGLPADSAPTAFAEDAAGDLWVGFWEGELGRFRDGDFERLGAPGANEARGAINDLYRDRSGRLWIATAGRGALRVEDPAAERPAFERIAPEILSSRHVRCVTEDAAGRIYFGTRRGLDRFDPETGRVRHYTMADGLPNSYLNACVAGRDGDLWFGTMYGVARLTPTGTEPLPAPPVFIESLRVAGVPRALPGLVVTSVPPLRLSPAERRIEIGFGGLEFATGGFLRFQYRLSDEAPWSEPTDNGAVLLAGLSPGSYRFAVRAVNADGVASPEPAVVPFTVLRPVWQRGWFVALAGLLLAGGLHAAYRVRLARALALERQRTRIAMDLHDDIGSGLGSIGLLADMAGGEKMTEERRRDLSRRIGDTAAELGTALGDIVGALRPGGATLESVARQLAERGRSLFPATGTVFSTAFPDRWPRTALSLPVRRNVFLVGVEALHNAARHAGAASVRLELAPEGRAWRLSVRDDGRGLDPTAPEASRGLGLQSMRRRAEEIGALLRVESPVGGGTEVTLVFRPRAIPA